MAYDFKSEEDVKQFLHNLGIEYRFGCYSEKNPEVCHLLGDYMEAIKKDFEKSAKVYKMNCDEYKYGKSCFKYGSYAFIGKGGVKEDTLEGFKYMEQACASGESEGCLQQGMMLISPKKLPGIPHNPEKGVELMENACLANNANACYLLSSFYINGLKGLKKEQIIGQNMRKAFELSEKACDLDHIYSCVNLSQMYSKGDGVEKNPELAAKYKKKALDMQEDIQSNQTLKFGLGLD